ncbi:hypothetical protein POTOM_016711 [Populus tomentosa]|uniref:Protein kinase domain-containing protein n=1 Tax=Populus tomentosa TaxID=118781 RepID=A0A8X8A9F3_POPTO|nr:hypothetical protein POTOM_016711 [Populus tomentosa]
MQLHFDQIKQMISGQTFNTKSKEKPLVWSEHSTSPDSFLSPVIHHDQIPTSFIFYDCSGYMSPEYAIHGQYSIKSDVFSYGVLALEIISGRKNSDYGEKEPWLNLIGHVWDLWREEKALDIVAPMLEQSCPPHEVLRCIQIGLLCVQEFPDDRPTMLEVVFMLGNEITLPSPTKPAFVLRTRSGQDLPAMSRIAACCVNEVTVTMVAAR